MNCSKIEITCNGASTKIFVDGHHLKEVEKSEKGIVVKRSNGLRRRKDEETECFRCSVSTFNHICAISAFLPCHLAESDLMNVDFWTFIIDEERGWNE